MSQRNRKSKCREGREGASMCTSAHCIMSKVGMLPICILQSYTPEARYVRYMWWAECVIITKGLKRLSVRRQQLRRSYLSQFHLSHLSCTLITAVIWGILRIVLGKKILCEAFLHAIVASCLVMFLSLHSKIEWNLERRGVGVGGVGGGEKKQREAGETSEAGCARID